MSLEISQKSMCRFLKILRYGFFYPMGRSCNRSNEHKRYNIQSNFSKKSYNIVILTLFIIFLNLCEKYYPDIKNSPVDRNERLKSL